VSVEEIHENLARICVEPLEHGYGETLGNSLRRVLLSSLEGAAVQAIAIDGVQHEFSTIEGVHEDVTDIVLNVKGLVFRSMGTGDEAEASINIDGPATVTGGDFDIPAEFKIVNPEHVICTLGKGAHLTMRMRIGVGRGYVSGEDNERDGDPIGVVHVDSLYSPVRRCAKFVEACRIGRHTDYDRLVLEVETNGSLSPRDAVVEAANIINHAGNAKQILICGDADNEQMQELFQQLRAQTPAVNLSLGSSMLADAQTLTQLRNADAVVPVVVINESRGNHIAASLKQIQELGKTVVGFVLVD
jgi:DNA-directed RNA polymerase alpha subunit